MATKEKAWHIFILYLPLDTGALTLAVEVTWTAEVAVVFVDMAKKKYKSRGTLKKLFY